MGADNFNEHQNQRLLVVNPFYGIDEDIADRAIRLLNQTDNTFDVSKLRRFSASRWPIGMGETHGVKHWDRVAKFGRLLYQDGADMNVIMAFAYLHDSERIDNEEDVNHGKRASKLIDAIRYSQLKELSDEQIEKLKRACELHTIEHRTGDITIDICFDADRMDLLRVGIVPLPERMATKRGAELVSNPKYDDYYQEVLSSM